MKKLMILTAVGLLTVSSVGCSSCSRWFTGYRGSNCNTCSSPSIGAPVIQPGANVVVPGPTSYRNTNKTR